MCTLVKNGLVAIFYKILTNNKMVDLFNLKVGAQLRYDVPETEKNELLRKKNGTVVEVVHIEHVYDMHWNPVIKPIVQNIETDEEFALGGESNIYLTLVKEGDGTTQRHYEPPVPINISLDDLK
jgi:hypothetical protein